MERLIITGAAGFIGSAVVREALDRGCKVLGVDKLTYAGNVNSLEEVRREEGFSLEVADICDRPAMEELFRSFRPTALMHLAAESHVDRSIVSPDEFIRTNIEGTFTLLEIARNWEGRERSDFRFHHVSTDEVYGDLGLEGAPFTESSRYDPSSPYSASKAASDHLVRAWARTYRLPVVISNSSNNYGPRQFPEKLIPHMLLNALFGKPLPIFGDGNQVRDWLYVEDHAKALLAVLEKGRIGATYNVGGGSETSNLEIVRRLCQLLEELAGDQKVDGLDRFEDLITHVDDRPGHDVRYAIDSSTIENELGWRPEENIASGLRKTVEWYLGNQDWWRAILDGSYRLERFA